MFTCNVVPLKMISLTFTFNSVGVSGLVPVAPPPPPVPPSVSSVLHAAIANAAIKGNQTLDIVHSQHEKHGAMCRNYWNPSIPMHRMPRL